MNGQPKTQREVIHERFTRQVMEVKALGDLALQEIDEALAECEITRIVPEVSDGGREA